MSFTDIFEAVRKGTVEDVRSLVEKEGKGIVNKKGQGNYTPLHCAASNGNIAIADFLISNGADVNARVNEEGGCYAPLHVAIMNRNIKFAKFLVSQKNADVDVKTEEGQTPLFLAIRIVDMGLVEFLVENRADICVKTKLGHTPLWAAKEIKNIPLIVKYLENAEEERKEIIRSKIAAAEWHRTRHKRKFNRIALTFFQIALPLTAIILFCAIFVSLGDSLAGTLALAVICFAILNFVDSYRGGFRSFLRGCATIVGIGMVIAAFGSILEYANPVLACSTGIIMIGALIMAFKAPLGEKRYW